MIFKNFYASVEVGGQPLEEYNVVQPTVFEKNCYIVSEKGATFQLYLKNLSDTWAHQVRVYIDGRYTNKEVYEKMEDGRIIGLRISDTQKRLFTFTDLSLVEDEHQNYTAIDMDILGSIDIYVYRSVLVGVMKKKQSSYELPPDIGHVSERSKMAGTHCVAFGNTVRSDARKPGETMDEYNNVDRREKPFCILRFRYRPKEILLARGIIPSPQLLVKQESASSHDQSFASRPDGNEASMLPHFAGSRPQTEDPRRQTKVGTEVKQEPSQVMLHTARKHEMIDLTGDSD